VTRIRVHQHGSTHGLDSGTEINWRRRGACVDQNPEWWHPPRVDSQEAGWAAHVCLDCPVMIQCDNWAQNNTALAYGAIYAARHYGTTTQNIPPLPPGNPRPPRVRWGAMPIDQIKTMAAAGWRDRDIAAAVGTTADSIAVTRRNHGIPSGKQARETAAA
jgi:hypothetical protein